MKHLSVLAICGVALAGCNDEKILAQAVEDRIEERYRWSDGAFVIEKIEITEMKTGKVFGTEVADVKFNWHGRIIRENVIDCLVITNQVCPIDLSGKKTYRPIGKYSGSDEMSFTKYDQGWK